MEGNTNTDNDEYLAIVTVSTDERFIPLCATAANSAMSTLMAITWEPAFIEAGLRGTIRADSVEQQGKPPQLGH